MSTTPPVYWGIALPFPVLIHPFVWSSFKISRVSVQLPRISITPRSKLRDPAAERAVSGIPRQSWGTTGYRHYLAHFLETMNHRVKMSPKVMSDRNGCLGLILLKNVVTGAQVLGCSRARSLNHVKSLKIHESTSFSSSSSVVVFLHHLRLLCERITRHGGHGAHTIYKISFCKKNV